MSKYNEEQYSNELLKGYDTDNKRIKLALQLAKTAKEEWKVPKWPMHFNHANHMSEDFIFICAVFIHMERRYIKSGGFEGYHKGNRDTAAAMVVHAYKNIEYAFNYFSSIYNSTSLRQRAVGWVDMDIARADNVRTMAKLLSMDGNIKFANEMMEIAEDYDIHSSRADAIEKRISFIHEREEDDPRMSGPKDKIDRQMKTRKMNFVDIDHDNRDAAEDGGYHSTYMKDRPKTFKPYYAHEPGDNEKN